MVRAMVHSTKHYVQFGRYTIGTGAVVKQDIVIAVEGTAASAVDETAEGSTIKAVYIELWLLDSGAGGNDVTVLLKNPVNASGPTFAQANALGTFVNKKNILFTHQGLVPNDGIAQPVNVMHGWYKIPKTKQRFGLGDRLHLVVANNSAQDLFACGFATYKEYT